MPSHARGEKELHFVARRALFINVYARRCVENKCLQNTEPRTRTTAWHRGPPLCPPPPPGQPPSPLYNGDASKGISQRETMTTTEREREREGTGYTETRITRVRTRKSRVSRVTHRGCTRLYFDYGYSKSKRRAGKGKGGGGGGGGR